MSIPRNLTEEEYEQVKEEMRREDAYNRSYPHPSDEEIEQATDERTLKDAGTHITAAVILQATSREEDAHEALVKTYNTIQYLLENPTRQNLEFTQADVQAAWKDGYEAAKEEDHPPEKGR